MKLFAYGDSWTEGNGVNYRHEELIKEGGERKNFRNNRSWPKVLSDLTGLDHQNQSIAGINNNTIFNRVIDDIKAKTVKEGDLIIVMWSSSLRDDVPFFPTGEWHVWGSNYISEKHKKRWFVLNDTVLTKNPSYNDFLINFKELYIDELFTQDYYNIINQNYIIFLQELFNFYRINYIFCDAFDLMVDSIKPEADKTHLINKKCYWESGKKTFQSFLIDTGDRLVWEEPKYDIREIPGMHPSESGYRLIAEEIYRFIDQNRNDIIRYDNTTKKDKIL
jgi:lysophospholipase L1-like esterase